MLTLPQNIVCGYFDCSEFDGLTASPVRKITKYEIQKQKIKGVNNV